jgi:hypothetical protein
MGSKGGVDPHTGLGPIPVFVVFGHFDLQTGQYCWQHSANLNNTSTRGALGQHFGDDFGLATTSIVGQLFHCRLEVGEDLVERCFVHLVKLP